LISIDIGMLMDANKRVSTTVNGGNKKSTKKPKIYNMTA